MISLLMSLFASMSHMVTDMFHGHENKSANNTPIVAKNNQMQNPAPYVKTNNQPVVPVAPHPLKPESANNESHVISKTDASAANKNAPGELAQYDNYAKNVTDLKRQIELNKLKMEAYKSQIDYEDPGSFDEATMIGVVDDPSGFKSARIKLVDDTITELMIGSRIAGYKVTAIDINAVTLLNVRCKRTKHVHHLSYNHKRGNQHQHAPDERIVVHTDTENSKNSAIVEENPLVCKPVKIYPLYRDINNRLPVNNSSTRSVGPASTGGARVYNNVGGVTVGNGSSGTSVSSGPNGTSFSTNGMNFTIPPIETGPHGN